MNTSFHLNTAILQFQLERGTNQLPETVVGAVREIEDLMRQGAIPDGMAVEYSNSDFPVLRVE